MKYTKIIFDLDDTLVPTHAHPEWKEGDYTSFCFSENVKKMLQKIGRENIILLTFDRYGDQRRKLDHLEVENYCSRVIVVDDKIKKRDELVKLKSEFGNILVVGDRYEEGELYYAEQWGLDTVCVAFPNGTHRKPEYHGKHLLVIESDEEYKKIFDFIN
jgi:FMN phosphatase YigB (HAD superfamily)